MNDKRQDWDKHVRDAVKLMTDDGATFPDVINRFVTFVGVHLVMQHGEQGAAEKFREFAASIEGGALSEIRVPERQKN